MAYSSVRTDFPAQRGKSKKLRLKFNKIDPYEVKFGQLENNGKVFQANFIAKTKKSGMGEKFYATGHRNDDMPRSMYRKKKADNPEGFIEYIPYFKDLCSQIPAYLIERNFEKELKLINFKAKINPNVNLRGETPLLDYRKLTLLQYIPDQEVKYHTLVELYKRTEPLPKEQVSTKNDREKEKVKARVRSLLVPAAIEFHIPEFAKPFVHKLTAKDHLLFLKDSIAAEGLTPELRMHFQQIEEKMEKVPQHGTKSRIYGALSVLEDISVGKEVFFHNALHEASQIKTEKAKLSCLDELRHLAQFHSNDPLYARLLHNEAFSSLPYQEESDEDLLATYSPVMPVMTSREMLLKKAEQSKSSAVKSTMYECLSLLTEPQQEKEEFFQLAIGCAKDMLSPKAKAARAVSLRSSAPTKDMQLNAHEIVLQYGSYRQRLQDMATISERKSAISKIGLDLTVSRSLAKSVDQGDRAQNIHNQKNFTRESHKLGYLNFWEYV